jgi:hypothetical protein
MPPGSARYSTLGSVLLVQHDNTSIDVEDLNSPGELCKRLFPAGMPPYDQVAWHGLLVDRVFDATPSTVNK